MNENLISPYRLICDKVINNIKNENSLNYSKLREELYDILIYNLDIGDCIYYTITKLIKEQQITNKEQLTLILIELVNFLKYYNNNYRPIYHLECFFLSIADIIR